MGKPRAAFWRRRRRRAGMTARQRTRRKPCPTRRRTCARCWRGPRWSSPPGPTTRSAPVRSPMRAFDAVYMTGAGTAASLGFPDFGLITMTEMVANAQRIARSVDVPVIADADTGYGNELNVCAHRAGIRARGRRRHPYRGPGIPQEMRPPRQQAGDPARGLHRQDPRRRATRKHEPRLPADRPHRRARRRSASTKPSRRANAALEAGADMAFVEAPQTLEEVAAVPKLVQRPLPAQHGVGRQDAARVAAGRREDGLPPRRSCPAC